MEDYLTLNAIPQSIGSQKHQSALAFTPLPPHLASLMVKLPGLVKLGQGQEEWRGGGGLGSGELTTVRGGE